MAKEENKCGHIESLEEKKRQQEDYLERGGTKKPP